MSERKGTQLEIGHTVQGRWKVLSKLGEGGYGAVYKVVDTSNKEERAMKIEAFKENDECLFKMETAVLKIFRNLNVPQPHVCNYVDSGATDKFMFLVMELVGRSLADLRRACPEGKFTGGTTTRLAIQCLEAVEALHRINFLHRDIKASNYAMGKNRMVVLLDFGLARQFVTEEGQQRPARAAAGFRGTVRYASTNTHLGRDLSRHDDLWSLFYMLVEFSQGELPWKKLKDKNEVLKKKKETSAEELLKGMEPEYKDMMRRLQTLTFYDVPNYAEFRSKFNTILLRKGYKTTGPFDWEEGGAYWEHINAKEKAGPGKKKEKPKHKKPVKEREEEEE